MIDSAVRDIQPNVDVALRPGEARWDQYPGLQEAFKLNDPFLQLDTDHLHTKYLRENMGLVVSII